MLHSILRSAFASLCVKSEGLHFSNDMQSSYKASPPFVAGASEKVAVKIRMQPGTAHLVLSMMHGLRQASLETHHTHCLLGLL